MTVDEMTVDEMTVDEMTVDEMTLDEMTVVQMACCHSNKSLFFRVQKKKSVCLVLLILHFFKSTLTY
jgi:hypothetical protein